MNEVKLSETTDEALNFVNLANFSGAIFFWLFLTFQYSKKTLKTNESYVAFSVNTIFTFPLQFFLSPINKFKKVQNEKIFAIVKKFLKSPKKKSMNKNEKSVKKS
jgi:hypothetical protein